MQKSELILFKKEILELKNKNFELTKINIDLENKNIELYERNLDIESKIIDLEEEIVKLKHELTLNNQISNQSNYHILVNDIYIFGRESLEHITDRVLEKGILEILECDILWDNLKNLFLEINGQRYKKEHIRDIDIHLFLTKLIYCNDDKNRTIKKENGLYYINNDDGWENVEFDYLNEKVLTKHQEILTLCEQVILENKLFMRSVKHYFQDDEHYDLIIKPTGIQNTFLKNYPRNKILKSLLDYELDNLDILNTLVIDHNNNTL